MPVERWEGTLAARRVWWAKKIGGLALFLSDWMDVKSARSLAGERPYAQEYGAWQDGSILPQEELEATLPGFLEWPVAFAVAAALIFDSQRRAAVWVFE